MVVVWPSPILVNRAVKNCNEGGDSFCFSTFACVPPLRFFAFLNVCLHLSAACSHLPPFVAPSLWALRKRILQKFEGILANKCPGEF